MSKHLVIVESPAKAKTIKRFLGKDFIVEASMGHVRDLPGSTLAVDVDHDFEPEYEVPKEKQATVKKLKEALKKVDDLWIATDEDREGEAIGWHLTQVLKEDPKTTKRIAFHEITETAIKAAVENPRVLDIKLVDAQQARRVLDRLVGYTLSPFLWKKVYRGLSAGRVQSVAVKIIVDREREIKAFNPVEYWSMEALLKKNDGAEFTALLQKKDDKKLEMTNKEQVDGIVKDLENASYSVSDIEEKELKRTPPAPFTTSTLQQEGSRKLGFSVRQTMVVAQQLYEGIDIGDEGHVGLITYMRTDSVNLSEKALTDAKDTIQKLYGREYVLTEPRKYKSKAKGAQEAHEAIRPTEISRTPQSLANVLDHQQLKLYTLVWNRTMATQMAAAELKRVGADIKAAAYSFRATGQTVTFDGFLRVYQEGRDEGDNGEQGEHEDGEKILPPLTVGEALDLSEPLKPEQHFTKPPPRYTEASLVKKLEEEGIGRPSTYAPTIHTIQQRGYIKKEGKQLMPEDVAYTVTDLLAEHFTDIVDLQFTAKMEQQLDDIADGAEKGKDFLKAFYWPFKELVDEKTKDIQKKDVMKERIVGIDPQTGLEVIAKLGRFGPFVQLGRMPEVPKGKKVKKEDKPKSASIPKGVSIDELTLQVALAQLSFPRNLGEHNGAPLTVAIGRFGPYIKCGETSVSLRDGLNDPATIDFDTAVKLLSEIKEQRKKAAEPLKTFDKDPVSGGIIYIKDGRFGPYVTDGKTNASVGKNYDPQTITQAQAEEILVKKRARGPSKWKKRG